MPKETRDDNGPDFVCIGMQKAGTKWLYDSLRQSDGFWMPPVKELHFADRTFLESYWRVRADAENLARCREIVRVAEENPAAAGQPGSDGRPLNRDYEFAKAWITLATDGYRVEDYRALFKVKGSAVSGDITPAYSGLDEADICRFHAEFPHLKIILLIRDPIARAWSAFNMYVRQILMSKEERKTGGLARLVRERATLAQLQEFMQVPANRQRSFPSVCYVRWAFAFGRDQVHVAFFDDMIHRPSSLLEDVCSFLGVALEGQPLPASNSKSSKASADMSSDQRAFLEQYFRDEYQELRSLFPGRFDSQAKA